MTPDNNHFALCEKLVDPENISDGKATVMNTKRWIQPWFPRHFQWVMALGCLVVYMASVHIWLKSNVPTTASTIGATPSSFNYTCLPAEPCWPTSQNWETFNQTINGRLRLTVPWASPCYDNLTAQCHEVTDHYVNGNARSAQYGSMEFLDWETCGQSSCMLNSMAPKSPVHGSCTLGRLSSYHVEAQSVNDVKETLRFVQTHGIRLSIKNSGHDYFGRSSASNSLALWTRKMQGLKYHKEFRINVCNAVYDNVGEISAGISAQEAWEYFEPLGFLVTVGAVGSVGLAGGFGQGGGHGPLGPKYGLMVDNAIEFEVVTADGQQRTINECSDPDLFWAMRGGGGGTFAVLTSYKFQLYPAVPLNMYSFQADFHMPEAQINLTESAIHRNIVRALATNQTLFAKHGVSGYNFLLPRRIVSLQILPSTDTDAIKSITSDWQSFLTQYPGLRIRENAYYSFSKFSEWHNYTLKPSIAHNGPVGMGISESGRFLPKKLFRSPESIENIVDAVVSAMQISFSNGGGGAAQLYATGPLNHPDNSKTGVNPHWREAMWEVIMGGFWTSNMPETRRSHLRNTISASIEPLKALTPNGGCYMNEGDWTEVNWQETFFGGNYDRLLDVKRKYDPTGLFNCWKCVGWTGYEEYVSTAYNQSTALTCISPMFSCYSRKPTPTVPLGPVV